MDTQEQFFQNQINIIRQSLQEKEDHFERLLQAERGRWISLINESTTEEEAIRRKAELNSFLHKHALNIIDFDEKREKMFKMHEESKIVTDGRYVKELLELEKEFERSFTKLMEEHLPPTSEEITFVSGSN